MDSSCRNCFLHNFLLEVAHASALFDPQAGKGFWWEKCLLHLFSNASLSSKLFSTRVCFTQFSPHQADFLASVRAKLTSERRRGFDLLRAKPATPQWPVAHCCSSFFWVTEAKASTVPEEHVKDPWCFMWHCGGPANPSTFQRSFRGTKNGCAQHTSWTCLQQKSST